MDKENGRPVERWEWIEGYLGLYSISNLGRLKSHHFRKPRLLALVIDRKGYETALLCRPGDRKRRVKIHRLVCRAFHGPAPFEGAEVAHRNGNRRDNREENVRWASSSENELDKLQHGTLIFGQASHLAKLSNEQVRKIKADSRKPSMIAAEYGVSHWTIRDIRRGKRRVYA